MKLVLHTVFLSGFIFVASAGQAQLVPTRASQTLQRGPASDIGSFAARQSDFAALYNGYRAASPEVIPWPGSYWPFGDPEGDGQSGDGIAWRYNGPSPAEKWDKYQKDDELSVTTWEKSWHSCKGMGLKGEDLKGCNSWWGHCNAWAAAGIKEQEPRRSISSGGINFSVGDQKAYLTELWMESDSLFAGDTDKGTKTASWFKNENHESYAPFWDVTPRTFFLIFTNYIGVLKTGIVIDRFTGDQVWNQSVVGYRILPIRKSDDDTKSDVLAPEVDDSGRTLYPVLVRMKIYWANDGVEPDHVSTPFRIEKTTDREKLEAFVGEDEEYAGRFLKFILYFDGPLELAADGSIASAGRIVGDGVWYHQIEPLEDDNPRDDFHPMNDTHPDFIWLPTHLMTGQEDANPYLPAKQVYKLLAATSDKTGGGGSPREDSDKNKIRRYEFHVPEARVEKYRGERHLARALVRYLRDSGVQCRVDPDEFKASRSGATIVKITVTDGTSRDKIKKLLIDGGWTKP